MMCAIAIRGSRNSISRTRTRTSRNRVARRRPGRKESQSRREADGLPFYMPTPVRQLLLLFSLAAARVLAADAPAPSAEGTEFFEQHIRPALIEYCYKCHSADA